MKSQEDQDLELCNQLLDRLDEMGLTGSENPLRLRAIRALLSDPQSVLCLYDKADVNDNNPGFKITHELVHWSEVLWRIGVNP